MLRTRDQVMGVILTPARLRWIIEVILAGLRDYEDPANYGPLARLAHDKSARAMNRNRHIVRRAVEASAEMPDIHAYIRGTSVVFDITGLLCVKFKKLDRHLRPRNISTKRVRAFLDQQPTLHELPPEITNIVAGYKLDDEETGIGLWVTCPDGAQNAWEEQLAGFGTLELPMMPAATAPATGETPRRVIVRGKEAERKREADETAG